MEADKFPRFDLFPRVTRAVKYVQSLVMNTNVQLCESDHYNRDHFTDAPIQPAGGLPPAERFED